jgi:preprotein translocase subunit SecE
MSSTTLISLKMTTAYLTYFFVIDLSIGKYIFP